MRKMIIENNQINKEKNERTKQEITTESTSPQRLQNVKIKEFVKCSKYTVQIFLRKGEKF